jgi:hypothetical protein
MKSFFIENLEIKYIIYGGRLLFKAPKLEGFLTPYQIKNLNEEHGFTLNSEAENEVLFKEGGRGIYLYQNFFFFKIIQFISDTGFISLIKNVCGIKDSIEVEKLKEENEILKAKIAALEFELNELKVKKKN